MDGDANVTLTLGAAYIEQGASSDTGEAVTVTSHVDVDVVGEYIVTYTATDAAGNTATVTRTVNVVD